MVFLCEGGRIEQRVKNLLLQLRQDTETLMGAGLMVGDAAEVCLSGEALFARLADFPVVMLDALPTSRHPLKPRGLLTVNATPAQLLRRQPGNRRHGSGALSEHWQRRAGALRRGSAGQQPAAAAGRPEHPRRAGSERGCHAQTRRTTDHRRRSVRRMRMAVSEAGRSDGRAADCCRPEKAEAEKGLQPAEAAILHRPFPRRSGGA